MHRPSRVAGNASYFIPYTILHQAKQSRWQCFSVKKLEEKLREVDEASAKYSRKRAENIATPDRLAKYDRKLEKRRAERLWLMERINDKIAALEWSPGEVV